MAAFCGDQIFCEKIENKIDDPAQQQLQMRGASLQQSYATQIKAKMDAALGDIAKEKKLDTVVNSNTKDGVIITGGVDVTDEVISKLQ